MLDAFPSLDKFFTTALDDLPCDPMTKAYIVSIFTRFRSSEFDLSNDSITLTFHRARKNGDFQTYQSLGDWLFFCQVEFPEHLHYASEEYYVSIGRSSYYACYRLLNRSWKVYEEIADTYEELNVATRNRLSVWCQSDRDGSVSPRSSIFATGYRKPLE